MADSWPLNSNAQQRSTKAGSGAVLVNPRQKGNPTLQYFRLVTWQYQDIIADYIIGETSGALFLSLKYHRLHPEYIYGRIGKLGHSFDHRILLVLVDIDNHQDALKELTKTSLVHNMTIFCAWSYAEAAHYLQAFKTLEFSQPTIIQERQPDGYFDRVVEALSSIRGVNKTDSLALVSHFGSVKNALNASEEQLYEISGWGASKIRRLREATERPFLTAKAVKLTAFPEQSK